MAKKGNTDRPPQAPREFPAIDKDMGDAIMRADLEWGELKAVSAAKKAEAKDAKEQADAAGERVHELIAEARSGQKRLPFDGVLGEGEDWEAPPNVRGINLKSIEPAMHPATRDALAAGGVVTIGDAIDELKRNHTLTGLNGIGGKGAATAMKAIESCIRKEQGGDAIDEDGSEDAEG